MLFCVFVCIKHVLGFFYFENKAKSSQKKTAKQTSMQNLELFWQRSILDKKSPTHFFHLARELYVGHLFF